MGIPNDQLDTASESDRILMLVAGVLKRRKLLVVACLAAVMAVAEAYNRLSPAVYEASVSMELDDFDEESSQHREFRIQEVMFANRLEELKSYSFALDIARELPDSVRERIALPLDRPTDFDAEHFYASFIRNRMRAFRLSNSNIIRLILESNDPDLCVQIANTAGRVFQERNYRAKREGVSGMRQFLENQLERSRTELEGNEERLRNFKSENQITSFDDETRGILTRVTEAEVLYNEAVAKREAAETKLESVEKELARQRTDLVPNVTDIATKTVTELRARLVNLEVRLTELRVQGYDATHPTVLQLTRDIAETKQSLTVEAQKIAKEQGITDPLAEIEKYGHDALALSIEIEELRAQEDAARRIIESYENTLKRLPDQELELARLTREVEVGRKSYTMLFERLEAARLAEAEKIPTLRLIDAAYRPDSPVRPRKKLNRVLGAVVGLFAGLGLGFARESFTTSVESPARLERLTGWPIVTTVPRIATVSNPKPPAGSNGLWDRKKLTRTQRSLVSILEPHCAAAEAFRILRTNLSFHGVGDKYKTVLITSVAASEGKSVTSTNLAIESASAGERTLLIDSEVRRPGLHRVFNLDPAPGLTDLLTQNLGLKTVVRDTPVPNLQLISSGTPPDEINHFISISGQTIESHLEKLKERFSWIIIDAPPLLVVHDTTVLASIADAVLFVVNGTRIESKAVERARRTLERCGANVVGVVVHYPRDDASASAYYYSIQR